MATLSTLIGSSASFKGDHDATSGLPVGAKEGDIFRVSVAGTLSGQALKIGDLFLMQGGAATAIAGEGTIDQLDTNTLSIGTNAGNISTVTGDLTTHEGLANEHLDWTVAQAGKEVEITNLPSSVQNGLVYIAEWNATTNTPTLADGTGTQGNYYRVSVAGTVDLGAGAQTFAVGDRVVHDGTVWQKWDTTDEVNSVHTRTGDIVAVAGDYDASQVDFTPGANSESSQTTTQGALDEIEANGYVPKSAAFTAKLGNDYACDTGTAAFTVTLPAGSANQRITMFDINLAFGTNAVTVAPATGESIGSAPVNETLVLDIDGALVELVYSTQEATWLVNVLN